MSLKSPTRGVSIKYCIVLYFEAMKLVCFSHIDKSFPVDRDLNGIVKGAVACEQAFLGPNGIFHLLWLCGQSPFFLRGLLPPLLTSHVSRLLSRARAHPLLNLEKARDCSQYTKMITFARGISSLLHFLHKTGYAGHSLSWCTCVIIVK